MEDKAAVLLKMKKVFSEVTLKFEVPPTLLTWMSSPYYVAPQKNQVRITVPKPPKKPTRRSRGKLVRPLSKETWE